MFPLKENGSISIGKIVPVGFSISVIGKQSTNMPFSEIVSLFTAVRSS
jgi:hypothetical protein